MLIVATGVVVAFLLGGYPEPVIVVVVPLVGLACGAFLRRPYLAGVVLACGLTVFSLGIHHLAAERVAECVEVLS
ncbi:hypothetical protein C1Y63_04270 [Corynebacterium sp. 13CS0277]|nr:hypothetical protein C1Y63_04270 [Corynebacterium sp. 13CS0277]